MLIAFPPCTYLCSSGLHWNKRVPGRSALTEQAVEFFMLFANANVPKIAIENPIGCMSTRYRKPDQIIQPHWFNEPYSSKHLSLAEKSTKACADMQTSTTTIGEVAKPDAIWAKQPRSVTNEGNGSLKNIHGDCEGNGGSMVKYGRLLVTSVVTKNGRQVASCLCECGTIKSVRLYHLKRGMVVSCGCLKRERMRSLGKKNTKHGNARRIRGGAYRSWESMKSRCLNPQNPSFKDYGGRGIRVCERWAKSFQDFLSDMGDRPPGLSIERIDVNGDYEKRNCVWGTPRQQARNKRKHATVFFNGNAVKLVDVAEKSGKDYFLLYDRVFRQGWSVEDAITKPIDVTKRNNHG